MQFERNIVKDLKFAPKNFWSYVKSKTKVKSRIPTLKKQNGTLAVSAYEKAEALNEFFASTFTKEDLTNLPRAERRSYDGELLDNFVITPDICTK